MKRRTLNLFVLTFGRLILLLKKLSKATATGTRLHVL
jgi:hypothetical protein